MSYYNHLPNNNESWSPNSPRPLEFYPSEEIFARIYQGLMGFVLLFAVSTNAIAIHILLSKSYGKITNAKVLYASISFSDEVFLLASISSALVNINDILIRINHISGYVSTYTMAFIAFHRYKAIAFPMQNQPTQTAQWHIFLGIGVIWIAAISVTFMTSNYVHDSRLDKIEDAMFLQFCVALADPANAIKQQPYFALITMVFIPLGIGATFSVLAIIEIRKDAVGGNNNNSLIQSRNRDRSTLTILMVIIVFGACWTPISVFVALEGTNYEERGFCDYNYFLYLSLVVLLMVEFCANPVIYWLMNPTFRKGVWEMYVCFKGNLRFVIKLKCVWKKRNDKDHLQTIETRS